MLSIRSSHSTHKTTTNSQGSHIEPNSNQTATKQSCQRKVHVRKEAANQYMGSTNYMYQLVAARGPANRR